MRNTFPLKTAFLLTTSLLIADRAAFADGGTQMSLAMRSGVEAPTGDAVKPVGSLEFDLVSDLFTGQIIVSRADGTSRCSVQLEKALHVVPLALAVRYSMAPDMTARAFGASLSWRVRPTWKWSVDADRDPLGTTTISTTVTWDLYKR
jgi:hypothetical protein